MKPLCSFRDAVSITFAAELFVAAGVSVTGVVLVGPLPPALQSTTVAAAAVAVDSAVSEAALAYVRVIGSDSISL